MILKYVLNLDLGDAIEFGGQQMRVDYLQDPESRQVGKDGVVFMDIILVNAIGQSITVSVPVTLAVLVEAD